MMDGTFTFYRLQHRQTHESPWLKPEGKLSSVYGSQWMYSSWDVFGRIAEPWEGTESQNETYDVLRNTEKRGWWTLKYAQKALRRLDKAQAKGKFDSRDGYGKVCQAKRYEFRLVKTILVKITEIIQ